MSLPSHEFARFYILKLMAPHILIRPDCINERKIVRKIAAGC